jgi:peptidyl-prolyl cis-trans isomerase A (cyclophilin A)
MTAISIGTLIILTLQATHAFAFSGVTLFQGYSGSGVHASTARRRMSVLSVSGAINSDQHNDAISRRDATIKLVATAIITTGSLSSSIAHAEEGSTGSGRLIEFTVNNLDGEEGKTGSFTIQTHPEWAPIGAERFETLAKESFFDECRIFRVLPGFVAQFGINGNPEVQAKWRSQNLRDDPVKVSNKRGTVVFATAGPNTRTTQIFINLGDRNSFLDNQGFSPFGEVVSGMDVVDRFFAGYGEGAPSGKGPNQGLIQAKGNSYLEPSYPKLSYFSKASLK